MYSHLTICTLFKENQTDHLKFVQFALADRNISQISNSRNKNTHEPHKGCKPIKIMNHEYHENL